jgi:hypothetical protein
LELSGFFEKVVLDADLEYSGFKVRGVRLKMIRSPSND